MHRRTEACISLLIVPLLCAMEHEPSREIIKDASYLIYEGQHGIDEGIPKDSRFVTFYKADGSALETCEHNFRFDAIEKKLDPCAPKPRPACYVIEGWPAITVGRSIKKGTSGDFIVFYDKHHYRLAKYPYNPVTKTINDWLQSTPKEFLFAPESMTADDIKALRSFSLDISDIVVPQK